ncbi:MAG TPA: class I SAM-dependent methyltransferase [Thermoanaerobaculia bacterium]|nr:class I SAM-dependent methyltransferase [Thermoanaerobaculia bacterium]
MTWYKEWFGEEYLELYAHRDEGEADRHIAFVVSLFDEPPRRILDLACGPSRHAAALQRHGFPAMGVDLSLLLLAQSPALPRAAGDMRRLPFTDASFDWVLNFFTSIGYFETEEENSRVLEEIARVLAPHGRFLLDLMNLDATLAQLKEYEQWEDGERRVELRRWWDQERRRVNKRILLSTPGREPRAFLESVRAYTLDEVTSGLERAGLEVTKTFGSFAGEAYGRDSERLILVGRKLGQSQLG